MLCLGADLLRSTTGGGGRAAGVGAHMRASAAASRGWEGGEGTAERARRAQTCRDRRRQTYIERREEETIRDQTGEPTTRTYAQEKD